MLIRKFDHETAIKSQNQVTNKYYLLTESEVITGKSQAEALSRRVLGG